MLARIGYGVLWAIGAYGVAAVFGYLLVMQYSTNTHDRQMEAGMTAAFFFGPVAAVIGFIVGFIRHKRHPSTPRGAKPLGRT